MRKRNTFLGRPETCADAEFERAPRPHVAIEHGDALFHALAEHRSAGLYGVDGKRRELRLLKTGHDVRPAETAGKKRGYPAQGFLGGVGTVSRAHHRQIFNSHAQQDESALIALGRFHGALPEREKSIANVESGKGIPQEIGQALEGVVLQSRAKYTFECPAIDESFDEVIQSPLAQASGRAIPVAAVGEHDQRHLRRRAVHAAHRLQRICMRQRQIEEDDLWLCDFECGNQRRD